MNRGRDVRGNWRKGKKEGRKICCERDESKEEGRKARRRRENT